MDSFNKIFVNKKREGDWTYYYEKGNLQRIAYYKNNTVEGLKKEYHEIGELYFEANYIKGSVDETINSYNKNGKIQEVKSFMIMVY